MVYDMEEESWEQAYLLANEFNSPYHYTEEYKFNLNPWKGKDVKLAFVKNGTYQMAMDDIRVVTFNNEDITDIDEIAEINIYPNPAKDFLKIEIQEYIDDNLIITDLTGKTLITKAVTSNNIEIDVSSLNSGLYLIKIGGYIGKFIIK
jgi:hypothetical protein